jgi:energy-coupling factor transporter ATP-binding protein EcfA2
MAIVTPAHDATVTMFPHAETHVPTAPRSLEETGIAFLSLVELLTKVLFLRGQLRLLDLSAHIKLPASILEKLLGFMRTERLCEVVRRGGTDGDVDYQLTDAGRKRATGYLARNQYAGAAPVSLDAYAQIVARQSVGEMRVNRQDVTRGFHGVVVTPHLRDQFGAAMNSGRAIFLHGPAGSGKTFLAEHLRGLLHGNVAIPHAITVDDEVIQVFDPFVHTPVQSGAQAGNTLDRKLPRDARWVECERPVAITGGELTLAMLDLEFDRSAGYYRAPPHLKANNGILIVDDLGRQLVSPRELMNRWIVPLDRHRDYLTFHSGYKFMVPFDVVLIFSTNLKPTDLADPAFMRRLGHKIYVGALTEEEYKAIFRQVCDELEIGYVESVFEHLLHNHHQRKQRPLLACYPRDLLGQVRDFARYEGAAPLLTLQAIDRAWDNYFIASRQEDSVAAASNPSRGN